MQKDDGDDEHGDEARKGVVDDDDELDTVQADLKRKKRNRQQHQQDTSSALFGTDVPIPLSSDDKTALAIGISAAASIPGAYNGHSENSKNRQMEPNQLREIAHLRAAQRERPSNDEALEPCQPDTDNFIDDLQGRMTDFEAQHAEQDAEEMQQLKSKKQKRTIIIGLIIFVVLVGIVIGIVFGSMGGKNGNGNKDSASDDSQSSNAIFVNPCVSHISTTEGMAERDVQLRPTVVTNFPSMAAAIDTPHSPERIALCWVSDLDTLKVGAKSDDLMQRFLLALIYIDFVKQPPNGANGSFKLATRNWLTEVHECDWDFVDCDIDKNIKTLQLIKLGLVGTIPAALSRLSTLEIIELSSNILTGEVPSNLWSMSNLKQVQLNSNRLSGAIFEGSKSLPELKILSISRNMFNGTLPQSWNMPNLEMFDISDNNFEGSFPDSSALSKLGK